MERKYKQSLRFWLVVFSVLLLFPLLAAWLSANALESYIYFLYVVLAIIFGPGVPLYLFYKIYKYSHLSKNINGPNIILLGIGITLLFITAALWIYIIFMSFTATGDGPAFGFYIIPLLIIGAIGEKCAKSSVNA